MLRKCVSRRLSFALGYQKMKLGVVIIKMILIKNGVHHLKSINISGISENENEI